ncbi:hypothetical protein JXD38_05120 [candidate division WOR-3 bacterium]|nr:hypothetical protein [candidate division WOR-3 bacterium]
MGMLKIGTTVRGVRTGRTYRVGTMLGGGSQGEVYRATLARKPVALKWHFPEYVATDTQLRERLETMIDRGAPSPSFIWPTELVESATSAGWGGIMPLREPRFKSILGLFRGSLNPTFWAIVTAGFELSRGFSLLHERGLCFRTVDFGSVFFDPATGEVRILGVDETIVADRYRGFILGAPGFLAPEVVTGRGQLGAATDRHLLAVLFFLMLYRAHPLDGKRKLAIRAWDLPTQRLMYGEKPVFIFDPGDRSNKALPRGSYDLEGEAGANAIIFRGI